MGAEQGRKKPSSLGPSSALGEKKKKSAWAKKKKCRRAKRAERPGWGRERVAILATMLPVFQVGSKNINTKSTKLKFFLFNLLETFS